MSTAVAAPVRVWPVPPAVFAFGALVLLCYAPAIASLFHEWTINDDMGHGFFVPVIAGYIVWRKREELRHLPPSPTAWGLPLVLLGALECLGGALGVEQFLWRSALIVTLTGLVWTVAGTGWLKKLSFPLLLLCFMVPLPTLVYNSITFPLQILATRLAAAALSLLDIPVLREGNVLQLPSGPLSVVEACSGIRSLLSLTFLSLVYGYFFETRRPIRITLLLATVPIAIFANAGRVTITGILSTIKPELAQGFFHESTGWVIFMLALSLLVAFHQAVTWGSRLFRRA